ncbi:CzcB/NccB family metal efflux transporter periplasmic adaptor subunit [Aquifex aeolicus]|uniref:Acriflavin resistance protein AcrE n=1 Tax=Aquifex aeolicus (strain VF5) TaxID=224324 RepID=O66917_AQUAE|nr:CzcB/NccB family metal efflux transporter periplasmic adaptor subunit [Aquifex aeolicus]AAC06871.1 acriflavin resistance protein AcrE [Aquifex aeolicus VF5]
MKTLIKYMVFLVIPIVLIIMWLAGVFHPKIHAEEVKRETKTVSGLVVEPVKVVKEVPVEYPGTIVAGDRAEISTRVMGYVVDVKVKEGDFVKKGQTLFVIDPRDVKAQINIMKQRIAQAQKNYEAAKAHYEAVKKTYERFKKLLKEGAITQHEFDQVEAQYLAAKAKLQAAKAEIRVAREAYNSAKAQLSYAEVKAPFDGYVIQKMVDRGDIANPGMPLAVLETRPYKVEVSFPEKYFGEINIGDTLEVYVEKLGRVFPAKVVEVEPAVDPVSRTFKVKALIDDNNVKSGLFVKVFKLEKIEEPTVLIPEKAIYKRWDFTGVWVVKPDGTLQLRLIRLGRKLGNYYEVLAGLSPGERIVVEGIERACEGCRVGG